MSVRNWPETVRNFAVICAGAPVAAWMGDLEFWRLAQTDKGPLGKIAMGYIARQKKMFRNYWTLVNEADRDTLTDIAKASYSDDSLHGFGDTDFARGEGKPLIEQQRAKILPLVEKAIIETGAKRVVEIGTGNGDIAAYLAEKHPDVEFVGIDFSVKNALAKHNLPNLSLVKGYALDIIEAGRASGDVVFGSSTWVLFSPAELRRYLRAVRQAGFRQIAISEPTINYDQSDNADASSHHLDGPMWAHNYAGYFREAGYEARDFEYFHFSYRKNPNRRCILIRASL